MKKTFYLSGLSLIILGIGVWGVSKIYKKEKQQIELSKIHSVGDLILAESHISTYYKVGTDWGPNRFEIWKTAPYTLSASVNFEEIKLSYKGSNNDIAVFTFPEVVLTNSYKRWEDAQSVYGDVNMIRRNITLDERQKQEQEAIKKIKQKIQDDEKIPTELILQAQRSAEIYLKGLLKKLYGDKVSTEFNFTEASNVNKGNNI